MKSLSLSLSLILIDMANLQEKPLKEHDEHKGEDIDDYDEAVSPSGCCCHPLFSFKWRKSNDNERGYLLQQKGEQQHRETWWVKRLNKVKEVTEVLAGPKWKNLIRKIGGYRNNKSKKERNKFQYDPQSYALNFDNSVDGEEDGLLRGFSSRFSAPFYHEQQRAGS